MNDHPELPPETPEPTPSSPEVPIDEVPIDDVPIDLDIPLTKQSTTDENEAWREAANEPKPDRDDQTVMQGAVPEEKPEAVKRIEAHPFNPQDPGDVLTKDKVAREEADAAVLAESRKHTRRSFVVAAAGVAAGYGFYRWIDTASGIDMQPAPLRRAFHANAAIARTLSRDHALAPTYSPKEARDLRVNGVYGLKRMLVPESWRLQLVGIPLDAKHPRFTDDVTAWEYRYTEVNSHDDQGHDTKVDPNARTAEKMAPEPMLNQAKTQEERSGRMPRGREEAGESRSTLHPRTPGLLLTMEDILALPRHELVTQFKCIEGWSQIVHWAGVRMVDFLEAYPPKLPGSREPKYVYMETPDGDYYTGYDLEVCRHPQTLLVTEMMGAPLTQFHGAPLRLHMPTKYGYKQIKRIGLISYTNDKPDDYWTKLGYDWYAGL
ncbi:MAG: molybdopterin-dependent oxidoreductase [Edaphobacter sp.]